MPSLSAVLFATVATVAWASDADEDFLKRNAEAEGVKVLPSGLQYKIIKAAEGGARPSKNDKCECHYEGSLIDGTVFDSSRKRGTPSTFAPSQVIAGWTEALQLMSEGERWQLFIPAPLGYGSRGAGAKIPGGATLIFDLELIKVKQSSGIFSKLPFLDQDVGPFKMWMLILAFVGYKIYTTIGGGARGGKKVTASHILVKGEQECLDLLAQLKQGSTSDAAHKFAALAKKHSTCPSGKSGGSLGTFAPGQMVPEFDRVCWAAPVGEVQGPVQTQFGFHLILVTERVVPGAVEEKPEQVGEQAGGKDKNK